VKNGGANREFHPQEITSPLGDKFTPGGQLRPWGSKCAPRGEFKNGSGLLPAIDTWLLFSLGLLRLESGKWMWQLVSDMTRRIVLPEEIYNIGPMCSTLFYIILLHLA
jgi:hypothetical protein